jgi:hypothetical protein
MKKELKRAALFFAKSITSGRHGLLRIGGITFAVLLLVGCKDLKSGPGDEINPQAGANTVIYGAGNGKGQLPSKVVVDKGTEITLPSAARLVPPVSDMVFAGWYDGTLTYAAGDTYTVTDNTTLEARWGFTLLVEINAYLASEQQFKNGNDTLLVVCDKENAPGLTWNELVQAMSGKSIMLDLSASTLNMSAQQSFVMPVPDSVKKLILPRAAQKITMPAPQFPFNNTLKEVSGLNVTLIDQYAMRCTVLETASFPAATTIGQYAFYGCLMLKTAYFPAVTDIGLMAFGECDVLETAHFPAVTTIGPDAFWGCDALETAHFPAATTIGAGAFYESLLLKTVNIPLAESIGGRAFFLCRLETVSIGKDCDIQRLESPGMTTPILLDNNDRGFRLYYNRAVVGKPEKTAGTYRYDVNRDQWSFTGVAE